MRRCMRTWRLGVFRYPNGTLELSPILGIDLLYYAY